MKYTACKFETEGDIDITDGDVARPTGLIKYTNEGMHGPEVQFMGRSLPIATGIMPTASAIAGTAYGARRGGVKGGLIGGTASTAASMLVGSIIENERRKRNAAEHGIQL